MRAKRGSVDFDLPEAEVVVDSKGEPISIKKRPRLHAHRLIEQFMVTANEAVTEWMLERKWPFLYRVHEEPTVEAMERFQTLARNLGISFRWPDRNREKELHRIIGDFLEHIEGTRLSRCSIPCYSGP